MQHQEGFFERWMRIARQKFAAGERQVDDPAEALDVLVGNQLAAIAQSRTDLLTVASSEKRLQGLVDEFEQRRARYEAAATAAIADGKSDLARTSMRRCIEAERLASDGRRHVAEVATQRAELAELIEQMRAEYDRLRMRRESVNALASSARASAAGHESLTAVGELGSERERSLEATRETLARLQSRASALADLREAGALDAVGAGEFDGRTAISDSEIDRRLTALKP
jgi:phage shock protein A